MSNLFYNIIKFPFPRYLHSLLAIYFETFVNNFPDVYYYFLMMTILSKPVELIIVFNL